MAITIRDVARESGVSVATVSYVLNNGPRSVRAETRQRVVEAMRHLDYHPNAMARGLVRQRLNTLGVLFGNVEPAVVSNPYASTVLQGVFFAAAELGYNITLFPTPWKSALLSAAPFRDRRTDGVLVIAPLRDSDMVPGLASLVPLVVVSAPAARYGVPSVDVDNARGARLAAQHFIALGHTRIAHLSGDENQASVPTRREAFFAAVQEAGIPVRPEYVARGEYESNTSHAVARQLLTLKEPPTAIFAGNDVLAFAVIEEARDLGIRVPEDLSVIGFDDIAAASQVHPALTTIRQPLVTIGEKATRLLIRIIEDSLAAQKTADPQALPPALSSFLEEPVLIVRATTAPPPLQRT